MGEIYFYFFGKVGGGGDRPYFVRDDSLVSQINFLPQPMITKSGAPILVKLATNYKNIIYELSLVLPNRT